MIINIVNFVNYHYLIIETIIHKYDVIIGKQKDPNDTIYLYIIKNDSFKEYILARYPTNLIIVELFDNHAQIIKPHIFDGLLVTPYYDYYIDCTAYYYKTHIRLDNNKHHYLIHDITDDIPTHTNNLFYITPLSGIPKRTINIDILPFMSEIRTLSQSTSPPPPPPIYIIQGGIEKRNLRLLEKILQINTQYDFQIKIVGKKFIIPEEDDLMNKILLDEYKIWFDELFTNKRVTYLTDLNFIDFHKQFLDCYAILPLITKTNNPKYYTTNLTTSINYGLAYKLKFIVDKDLADIYQLGQQYIFNNENDIAQIFEKSLWDYYAPRTPP